MRRFSGRYIDSVKSSDGRVLRSNREMRDVFRAHFRDRFARHDLVDRFGLDHSGRT